MVEEKEEDDMDAEEIVANAISLLRQHGIYNIEEREPEHGWSILMQTVISTEGVDKVQVLLDARADPNRRDRGGRTALMWAAILEKVEVVKALLAANAAVGAQAREGTLSALSCAVKQNCVAVAEALIEAGADVNMRSRKAAEGGEEEETALGVALMSGAEDCVRLLLERRADPDVLCGGRPPVLVCVHEDLASTTRHRMLAMLFAHGAAAPTTALHSFAVYDDAHAVKLCIKAGAEVDARNEDGRTPMSVAVMQGALSVISKLVAAGADVNREDEVWGETLLMEAAESYGETAAVMSKLVELGADVNAKHAEWGYTALQRAVKHPGALKVLLDAGAEVDEGDEDEETALMKAAKEGAVESITVLLDHGADVNLNSYMEQRTAVLFAADNGHAAAVKALVDRNADLEICEADNSYSPLDMAISKGHVDTIRMLLRCKACANPPPEDFRSPLFVAAATGQAQAACILLQAKALVDYQDEDGVTPLMKAAHEGAGQVVRVLLAARADPSLRETTYDAERQEFSHRCGSGANALEMAEQQGHADIARLIQEASASSDQSQVQVASSAASTRAVTASDSSLSAHTSHSAALSQPVALEGTETPSPLAAFNSKLKFGTGALASAEGGPGGAPLNFSFGTGQGNIPGAANGSSGFKFKFGDNALAGPGVLAQQPALVGQRCSLVGLVKKPEYNGLCGSVASYDEASMRFGFVVEERGMRMSVKARNLRRVEVSSSEGD